MKTKPIASMTLLVLLVTAALSVAAAPDRESLTVKALETKGNQVRVLVSNSGAKADAGTVHLQVTMNGATATAVQQVSVPPKGESSTLFTFDSRVTAILYVGIIEDPDPIP